MKRREHIHVTRTGDNLDRAADYLVDGTRFARAELVNEVHVDRLVGKTETDVFATGRCHGQPRGREMRFSG